MALSDHCELLLLARREHTNNFTVFDASDARFCPHGFSSNTPSVEVVATPWRATRSEGSRSRGVRVAGRSADPEPNCEAGARARRAPRTPSL